MGGKRTIFLVPSRYMRWRGSTFQWVGLILLLILVAGIGGCWLSYRHRESDRSPLPFAQNRQENRQILLSDQRSDVVVYFATTDKRYLVPVTLPVTPTQEVAKVAVEKLLAGPPNEFLARTVPKETKLRDIYLIGDIAYVDLTNEINAVNNGHEAQQAIDSLVLTLTGIPQVTGVQFLIDGQVAAALGGVTVGAPCYRPENLNATGNLPVGAAKYQVYFADSSAMYLVPVVMAASGGESLAYQALASLVAGPPAGSNLGRTVWPGTAIKGVKVDAGVVAADFNQNVTGYGGGSTAERLLVESVVLTLTGLPDCHSVQFLIDGKTKEYLPEGTEIKTPLIRPAWINYIENR